MKIYPAIDIRGGKCVRLLQGRFDDMTVFGDSPADMAEKWERLGGEYIHVVDLDGARGDGANDAAIRAICGRVSVPVQTGGGVRTMDDIRSKLDGGAARVIIGTAAVRDKELVRRAVEEYGDRIVVGIDAKDGMVAIEGWETVSALAAVEFAKEMESIGVKTIVYTDIATDGTLAGPNIAAMREMAETTGMEVIASGGVGSEDDIIALKETGVAGVIVGKAIYTDKVDLKKIIELAR
jgi:phosphoribosylformimino-5-aminoimidazole carboxamide ribotide isomerase